MKSMILKLFIASTLLISSSLMAMDNGALEMLKSMKIDKTQVAAMLDNLEKMGRITPEQAQKAKAELNKLNDSDMKKYQDAAVKKIASGESKKLINQDFTKSSPKINSNPAPVTRAPASSSAPIIEDVEPAKVDFTKLGQ